MLNAKKDGENAQCNTINLLHTFVCCTAAVRWSYLSLAIFFAYFHYFDVENISFYSGSKTKRARYIWFSYNERLCGFNVFHDICLLFFLLLFISFGRVRVRDEVTMPINTTTNIEFHRCRSRAFIHVSLSTKRTPKWNEMKWYATTTTARLKPLNITVNKVLCIRSISWRTQFINSRTSDRYNLKITENK